MDQTLPQRLGVATQPRPTGPSEGPAAALPEVTPVQILWAGRWWIVAGVVAALAAAAVYLQVATPIYESTAEIYVARKEVYRDNSPLDKPALANASPTTHGEIIRTTEVLAMALQLPEVAASRTLAGAQEPLTALRKLMSIEADAKEEIVRVSVESPYADEAAMLANSIVASYLRLQKRKANIGGWNVVTAGGLSEPDVAGNNRPPASSAAPLLANADDPPGEAMSNAVLSAQMSRLAEALTQAELAHADAEVRLRAAEAAGDDLDRLLPLASNLLGGGGDLHGLAGIRYKQAELAQLRKLIDDLPATWGDEHPRRLELQDRYKLLEHRYLQERQAAAAGIRELLAQNLRQAGDDVKQRQRALDEQTMVAARATQLPIAVIEPAQVPRKPARPQKAKTLALAGVLGMMMGSALAFVQDARRAGRQAFSSPTAATAAGNGLVAPDDVQSLPAVLGHGQDAVPVLGAVPAVQAPRVLAAPSSSLHAGAQQIHQVRALLQMLAAQHGRKSFAFVSPARGAGRTSVMVGVGSSLAMSGTRTLLVDCDLASRIARQDGDPGAIAAAAAANGGQTVDGLLIDAGCVDASQSRALTTRTGVRLGVPGMLDGGSLEQCVVPASLPGLFLLPAVFATPMHIGRMSPAFIKRLIAEAADRYDLVLFDTGPVPGSVEAMLVAGQVDGVVTVVPAGQDQRGYDRMKSYLKMIGTRIVGAVFNRVGTGDVISEENLGSGILAAAVFSEASSAYAADMGAEAIGDVTAGIDAPAVTDSNVDDFAPSDAPAGRHAGGPRHEPRVDPTRQRRGGGVTIVQDPEPATRR